MVSTIADLSLILLPRIVLSQGARSVSLALAALVELLMVVASTALLTLFLLVLKLSNQPIPILPTLGTTLV